MQDDSVLNVVNRYWNQFNEDIRVLLQRFDAETADELENKNESEVTTSFLMQLSTWDKEELDEKLANRVQVSKRAVAKIIQVFDRLMQRNDKISTSLKGELKETDALSSLDATLRQTTQELVDENRNLQERNIELHAKYHTISLKVSKFQDALAGKETEEAELRHQIDALQYELEKVRCRNDKLENHLAEAIEKLKVQVFGNDAAKAGGKDNNKGGGQTMTSVAAQHLDELKKELDEYKELANNRLQELDKLHEEHMKTLKEVEKLKMDIRQLPESVIVETTEYKCLQSQFSVLYNESMQIKTMLDETRNQLQSSKTEHLRQIEILESAELIDQKRLRDELLQKQYVLDQTRKEFENLRNKFEQNMAANEQTAPINLEMRHLITSLQNRNGQFKGEVQRYKRKYKEVTADNTKIRKDLEELNAKIASSGNRFSQDSDTKIESASSVTEEENSEGKVGCKEEQASSVKSEMDDDLEDDKTGIKTEKTGEPIKKEGTPCSSGTVPKADKETKESCNMIRDLKVQLKKALNDQKEMKLLLDMYKSLPKEQRDKVQLMAGEKKIRAELDELKSQMKKLQESKREERKKLADEDALRKIKQLEEQKHDLLKQIANQKAPDGQSWGYRTFVGSNVGFNVRKIDFLTFTNICRLLKLKFFLYFLNFLGRGSTAQ